MENALNHLCTLVDRQLNLYRKLWDLFHDERKAILASDLEGLNRVILEKEETLQRIRREEVDRRQVARDLASRLGLDGETLTISRLCAALGGSHDAAPLKEKGAALQALIDEIQIESDRNRALCLHALQFVNNSMKLLANLTRPNQVYHATGRVQNGTYTGRMLSGAV